MQLESALHAVQAGFSHSLFIGTVLMKSKCGLALERGLRIVILVIRQKFSMTAVSFKKCPNKLESNQPLVVLYPIDHLLPNTIPWQFALKNSQWQVVLDVFDRAKWTIGFFFSIFHRFCFCFDSRALPSLNMNHTDSRISTSIPFCHLNENASYI